MTVPNTKKYKCGECGSNRIEFFRNLPSGDSGLRCRACGHTKVEPKTNLNQTGMSVYVNKQDELVVI